MYRSDRVWMAKRDELLCQAKRYVTFCAKIYEHQRKNGGYFLHERPWLATSWMLEYMVCIERYPVVRKVETRMC